MQAIINSKRYDTDTATEIAEYDNGFNGGDFHLVVERLYKTDKGAYFLACSGGALSKYADIGGNYRIEGKQIRPLSNYETIQWLEKHVETDVLNQQFPDKIEDA